MEARYRVVIKEDGSSTLQKIPCKTKAAYEAVFHDAVMNGSTIQAQAQDNGKDRDGWCVVLNYERDKQPNSMIGRSN